MENSEIGFEWRGRRLRYNRIPVNNAGERAVEIPIAFSFLGDLLLRRPEARLIEIGNTLSSYENVASDDLGIARRRIIDKFDRSPGVERRDVMDLGTRDRADGIVSISTVEHVGQGSAPDGSYGEQATGPQRDLYAPLRAIAKIHELLLPGGEALVTFPYGRLTDGGWWIQASEEYLGLLPSHFGIPPGDMKTTFLRLLDIERYDLARNPRQRWVEAPARELAEVEFGDLGEFAGAIGVLQLHKGSDRRRCRSGLPRLDFAPPILLATPFDHRMRIAAPVDEDGTFELRSPGMAFFGPYIDLPPDRYRLQFRVDVVERDPGGSIVIDAIAERGERILLAAEVSESRSIDEVLELDAHATGFEVRARSERSSRIRFRVGVRLRSIRPPLRR
jgi:hypothetical protein